MWPHEWSGQIASIGARASRDWMVGIACNPNASIQQRKRAVSLFLFTRSREAAENRPSFHRAALRFATGGAMLRAVRSLSLALGILVVGACRQTTAPPVTLALSLQANTTVAQPGDTITFTVTASANNLFGVTIDYGDTTGDQYSTGGASTARVTFKHAYQATGSYAVRATVSDAIVGEKEASISIVVN